ncbi:hypothetical protein HanXRQr2_Chr07g0305681 [Helianthus annuus]|uniref:Uncharacterized protein n=1 Tax=Helianthus annuus TaxID=4232 RepID=A0A251TXP2_HELAN|nr:hypothetical protein HanXRQr2_Chr07g0305681 [Helianthus annuus]KAJ0905609.1 hypothetical protein HanPSC8_Chr07g0295901 [Helianthus annuus]
MCRTLHHLFFFSKTPHHLFFLPQTLSNLSVNTQQSFLRLPKSKIVRVCSASTD